MTEKIKNTNPVVELKAQIKQFGFENLRANKDNALANSGKQMYEDFTRQSFIINGKKIDRSLLLLLKGGC
ncbi:hypothetical protein [Wolbachia endosymbiont of Chironomus riparius]|uniref:hypothetical protein n=1 Tax=Wolbachia endosymbiont of Chironomus riparius TaxID=2883238 RepID=UPI00209CA193|nr:hypothetical protein [Wolbachia endosymbiont of Chironomus riparius]